MHAHTITVIRMRSQWPRSLCFGTSFITDVAGIAIDEDLRAGVEAAGQREVKRDAGQYQFQSGRQYVALQLLFSGRRGQYVEIFGFANYLPKFEIPILQCLAGLPGQSVLLVEAFNALKLVPLQGQGVFDLAKGEPHRLAVLSNELTQQGGVQIDLCPTLAAVDQRGDELTGGHQDPFAEQVLRTLRGGG